MYCSSIFTKVILVVLIFSVHGMQESNKDNWLFSHYGARIILEGSWEDGLQREFQKTHFNCEYEEDSQTPPAARCIGRCNLELCHRLSDADIKKILGKTLEKAYIAESESDRYLRQNYDPTEEFLNMLADWDHSAVVNYGPWYPPIEAWYSTEERPHWWNQETYSRKLTSLTDNGREIELQGDCIKRNGDIPEETVIGNFASAQVCFKHCHEQVPKATGCMYDLGVCSYITEPLAGSTEDINERSSTCWIRGYISKKLEDLQKDYLKDALDELRESQLNFFEEINNVTGAKERNIKIISSVYNLAYNFPANLRYGDSSSNSANSHCFDPMGNEEGQMTQHELKMLNEYWEQLTKPSQCFIPYTPNMNLCYTISSTGKDEVIDNDKLRWRIYLPKDGLKEPASCCKQLEDLCNTDSNMNEGCCNGLICEEHLEDDNASCILKK